MRLSKLTSFRFFTTCHKLCRFLDKKSQLAELTVVEEPSTTVSSLEYMRIGDPGSTTPLTNDVVPSSSAPNQPETSRQFQIIINPSNVAGGATRNVNETGVRGETSFYILQVLFVLLIAYLGDNDRSGE